MGTENTQKFIRASKYRRIQKAQGTGMALSALISDLGSEGALMVVKTPEKSPAKGQITAYLDDVSISSTNARGPEIGSLSGFGKNRKKALRSLLNNLLSPQAQAARRAGYRAGTAKLAVGNPFRPEKYVEVAP